MRNRFTARPWKTLVFGMAAALFATALLTLLAPAPASAAVPGYQFVPGQTDFNSLDSKTLTINCPAGKNAISASPVVVGGQGEVVLSNLNVNQNSVFIAASEDQDRTNANWRIEAQVLCVNPLPGLEYRAVIGPVTQGPNPGRSLSATATCSAGKRLIGAGAALTFGTDGQVSMSNLLLGDTAVTLVGVEDQDGLNGRWGSFLTAVCADPLPGLGVVPGRGSGFDSNSPKFDSPRCGTNQRALAAGWGVGGDGQVVVFGVAIGALGANLTAAEDQDGFAGNWSIGGHVICANP